MIGDELYAFAYIRESCHHAFKKKNKKNEISITTKQ